MGGLGGMGFEKKCIEGEKEKGFGEAHAASS
jgi:hypothetical protein